MDNNTYLLDSKGEIRVNVQELENSFKVTVWDGKGRIVASITSYFQPAAATDAATPKAQAVKK